MSNENKQNVEQEESLKADFNRNSPQSVSKDSTPVIAQEDDSAPLPEKFKLLASSYKKIFSDEGKTDFVTKVSTKQELSK